MDMTKIVLEGVLRVVDHSEKDPCASGPGWMTYIGDIPILEDSVADETIFDPFVGKRIRLTIEVLNDEEEKQ